MKYFFPLFPLYFTLLLVLGGRGLGQGDEAPAEYLVQAWDTPDGLPYSTVTSIAQDRDGFLWVGTLDGLARFDGVRFVRVGPDAPVGSYVRRVRSLLTDRHGQLWAGTSESLHRLESGSLTDCGPATRGVQGMAEDASGVIWLCSFGGLGMVKDGKCTWLKPGAKDPGVPGFMLSICFDRDGRLWFTDDGSVKTYWQGKLSTELWGNGEPTQFRNVFIDRAGRVWTGTRGDLLWCRDGENWGPVEAAGKISADGVPVFCESGTGDFWVGTRKGLLRRRAGEWKRFTMRDGLPSDDIRAIFEDRDGNLWLGTGAAGLVRLSRRGVVSYRAHDGLTDDRVWAVQARPGGGLWVGMNDGRLTIGRQGVFLPDPEAQALPADTPVKAVLRTRDGVLWVGTFGSGLWRFYEGMGRPVWAEGTFAGPADKVTALHEDREGHLWVGTLNGLFRLKDKVALDQAPVFTDVGQMLPEPVGGMLNSVQVTALGTARDGKLLVGYHGLGVARGVGPGMTWLREEQGLPSNLVGALHEDVDGTLWIGTAAGLCRWKDGKAHTFTREEGLVDDRITTILEDDADNLWLGSSRGLMRVARKEFEELAAGRTASLQVFSIGRGEGMASEECSGGFSASGWKTEDGRLWFPTAQGLVMVNPADWPHDPVPPAVFVDEVRADGRLLASHLAGNDKPTAPLVLPRGARRVEFSATALRFVAPQQVLFRHRLDGLEKELSEAGRERSVTYRDLPPGDYRFHVIAANRDGVWNATGATFPFIVPAYFWETVWFRGLLIFAGMLLVAGGVRFLETRRLRQKLERIEREQAVSRERSRIARDIHDDIGANLTQIAMLSELAQTDFEQPLEARGHIDRIFTTAHTLARSLDEIVWAVNPANDSLESFLTYICKFTQDYARTAGLRCRLHVPDMLPAQPLSSTVRHHLYLTVKEALHNVAKYARATEVRVHLRYAGGALELAVEDNGVGFDPGGIEPGDGLVNMRRRIEQCGGRFELESTPGAGTAIRFSVPVQ